MTMENTNKDIYEEYFKKNNKIPTSIRQGTVKEEFKEEAVYFLVNKTGVFFAITGEGKVLEETKNFRNIDEAIVYFQQQPEVRQAINDRKGNLFIIKDPDDIRVLEVFKAIHTRKKPEEELLNSKSNLKQVLALLNTYFETYPSMNFLTGLNSLGIANIPSSERKGNKEVVEILKSKVKIK